PVCPPSPMAVLSQILSTGQMPSPFVVQCAIAEAELLGRYDLSDTRTQQYGIPALQQQGGGGDVAPPAPTSSAPSAPPAPDSVPPSADTTTAPPQNDAGPMPDVPSPISGVADGAWSQFLGRLVREAPGFETQKHVGRYRHHKARLSEVGFDATVLAGDPGLQDLALSTDVADCFRHLHASGTLDQVVNQPITMPDQPGNVPASLSG